MKAIADTGFLVAFANARDMHHAWALGIAGQITEPLLTCEPVLAEAAFHLNDSGLVLEMISEGLVALSFNCNENCPNWPHSQNDTKTGNRTWLTCVLSA